MKSMDLSSFFQTYYAGPLAIIQRFLKERDAISICLRCDDPSLARHFFSHVLSIQENLCFHKIQTSNDFFAIQTEGTIKIDDIRQAISFSHLTVSELTKKYLWIDRMERIQPQAENAMLKLLEEPPTNTMIIVCCQSFHALLPTVQSRLFRLDLPIISPSEDSFAPGTMTRWIIDRGGVQLGTVLNAEGFRLEEYLETLQSSPIEDIWNGYRQLCGGEAPQDDKGERLETYTRKFLFSYRLSWELFWDALRRRRKREWLERFETMDREVRGRRSGFFTLWFHSVFDWIQEMVSACIRLDYSDHWYRVGCSQWINQWSQFDGSVHLDRSRSLVTWIARVQNMKSLTVHPQLTFILLWDQLEQLNKRRNSR